MERHAGALTVRLRLPRRTVARVVKHRPLQSLGCEPSALVATFALRRLPRAGILAALAAQATWHPYPRCSFVNYAFA